jgi:predicted O-methyltransferase YrrM
MLYVGDVSKRDAELLAAMSAKATRILEFGVGASTQVMAQSAPADATIVSVNTDPDWMIRTELTLAALEAPTPVNFLTWNDWKASIENAQEPYDLILDDGIDELRVEFASLAWPLLKVGGSLLFHDTRRPQDAVNALYFALQNFTSVDTVTINAADSNLTVIVKKEATLYRDWNQDEEREPWMIGWEPLGITLIKLQAKMAGKTG